MTMIEIINISFEVYNYFSLLRRNKQYDYLKINSIYCSISVDFGIHNVSETLIQKEKR